MTDGGATAPDPLGSMLAAHHAGHPAHEELERDDGHVLRGDPSAYFTPASAWPPAVRTALERVDGPVLDVGAGAGRHALALQERGVEVVAIDPSPGAVAVMRDRGVRDARRADVDGVAQLHERFATILLLGNNLGLLGHGPAAHARLDVLASACRPGARLVGETLDPYRTTDPVHLAYHESNRRSSRPGGQTRVRLRFGEEVGDWFDYRFLSAAEVRELFTGGPWAARDPVPVVGTDSLVVVADLVTG